MADVHTTETYNELQAALTSSPGAPLADNMAQRFAAADATVAGIGTDESVIPSHVMSVVNAYSPEAAIKYGK
jgi:hypothetical protein